jgi:hypothetical protein
VTKIAAVAVMRSLTMPKRKLVGRDVFGGLGGLLPIAAGSTHRPANSAPGTSPTRIVKIPSNRA